MRSQGITFRNFICMADLFFALSASLFMLSAQEGKTVLDDTAREAAAAATLSEKLDALEMELTAVELYTRKLLQDAIEVGIESAPSADERLNSVPEEEP